MKENMREKIRMILQHSNINQVEFAKRVGVTKGAVSQWLSGITTPTALHEKKIALAFRWLNIYWLWGMEENMEKDKINHKTHKNVEELQQTINLYEKLFKLKTN